MKNLIPILLLTIFAIMATFGYSQEGIKGINRKQPVIVIPPKPVEKPKPPANSETHKPAAAKPRHIEKEPQPVESEMVFVQGGTFSMGCADEQDIDCKDDETPAHTVTISNFYMGKYEVTQAQWEVVMGGNPSRYKGSNLPVENVSWEEVQEFIRRLNNQTGKQYRLPTEAEWEFAARGGNSSKGYKYSGSNNVDNVAWYHDNCGGKTHPVRTKLPNELGIYDMSGNVAELCSDWYDEDYYSNSPSTNPQGASSGFNHVLRGGNFYYDAGVARVSSREYAAPDDQDGSIGFRLACSSR